MVFVLNLALKAILILKLDLFYMSLLQNSPLYQYLQDLGHTDFEICSSLSPKPEKCTTEGQQKPPIKVEPKVRKHAHLWLNLLFFTLMTI